MYGKKDYDSVFKYCDGSGEVIALTAKDAFDIFYAMPDAEAQATTKDYTEIFNNLKKGLFKQDTAPRNDKGVIDAVRQIKQLKKEFRKDSDYLDDL